MQAPFDDVESSYDEMPYQSDPHFHSQPARLAAAARLMGLSAPDVRSARVLELGCASGGNLIPLAAQYPDAQFLGIDISGVQTALGQERILDLGLTNIEVRKAAIADINDADGAFDYIIAHGVYSWISDEVRDDMMHVIATHLRDDGIAYVSYNVYPGWHAKTITRDLMLYHRANTVDPEACIESGRVIVGEISRYATGAYASFMESEASVLENVNDTYIRHEHLEPHNTPVYFHQFVEQAEDHGLGYLCESDPVTSIPECMHPEIAQKVRALAGNDVIKLEQYLDFYIGRQFRSTLLVKSDRAAMASRRMTPGRMRDLHIHTRVPLRKMETPDESTVLTLQSGFTIFRNDTDSITVHTKMHILALEILEQRGASMPGTITSRALAQQVCESDEVTEEEVAAVDDLLL
jgi:SAM-dependent methyltransferase